MRRRGFITRATIIVALLIASPLTRMAAGTLTGSFSPIANGSNVNLTALGNLDWVQWGLGGDYAVNRKAGIAPLISNFTLISQNVPKNPLSSRLPTGSRIQPAVTARGKMALR